MSHLTFAPKDKEQRQSALIDAATAVFAERGYDAATTREIAERAGCAEGLIHRYFAGKRGLLLAILEDKGQHAVESYCENVPPQATVEEEIEAILLYEVDSKWEKRDFMRICVSEAAIDPEVGETVRDGIQSRQVAFIAARLRTHQDAGRIAPGVDVREIAYVINGVGFSAGFMNRIAFGRSREDAERMVLEAAAVIARGISISPTSADTPLAGEPSKVG